VGPPFTADQHGRPRPLHWQSHVYHVYVHGIWCYVRLALSTPLNLLRPHVQADWSWFYACVEIGTVNGFVHLTDHATVLNHGPYHITLVHWNGLRPWQRTLAELTQLHIDLQYLQTYFEDTPPVNLQVTNVSGGWFVEVNHAFVLNWIFDRVHRRYANHTGSVGISM
jgi:hypothetical protein